MADHHHHHQFTPNGDVLVDASIVKRKKRILFGLLEVTRTHLMLNQPHRYDGRIGSKVGADAAMLEIARRDGVSILGAYAMFLAVLLWVPNWIYWYAPKHKHGSGWRKR